MTWFIFIAETYGQKLLVKIPAKTLEHAFAKVRDIGYTNPKIVHCYTSRQEDGNADRI